MDFGISSSDPACWGCSWFFLVGNFFVSIPAAIYAALILARSGHDEIVFGAVNTVGAVGGLAGGLVMSAWGGPKRRVHGVLAGWALSGLLGTFLMGLGRGLVVWAVASFLISFLVPFINGSNQAIWQAKVAPDIQGRVFSIRRLIAWFVSPLAMLIAGPLADKVMEPAMQSGGGLAALLEPVVGSGAGSGMSVIFIVGGILAALVGLGGYLVPVIRQAESILPDHDVSQAASSPLPETGG